MFLNCCSKYFIRSFCHFYSDKSNRKVSILGSKYNIFNKYNFYFNIGAFITIRYYYLRAGEKINNVLNCQQTSSGNNYNRTGRNNYNEPRNHRANYDKSQQHRLNNQTNGGADRGTKSKKHNLQYSA
jgi:hypothetical protein